MGLEPAVKLGAVLAVLLWGCGQPSGAPGTQTEQLRPLHSLRFPEGVTLGEVRLVEVDEGDILVEAEVSSSAADTVVVEYGSCFARLVAFGDGQLQGPPVWVDRGPEPWGCADVAILSRLAPGGSDTLAQRVPTEVLNSWPPPEGSRLAVILEIDGQRAVLPIQ